MGQGKMQQLARQRVFETERLDSLKWWEIAFGIVPSALISATLFAYAIYAGISDRLWMGFVVGPAIFFAVSAYIMATWVKPCNTTRERALKVGWMGFIILYCYTIAPLISFLAFIALIGSIDIFGLKTLLLVLILLAVFFHGFGMVVVAYRAVEYPSHDFLPRTWSMVGVLAPFAIIGLFALT